MPFVIQQNTNGNWPSDPSINIKLYDQVQWVPNGNKAPQVGNFSPSNVLGPPATRGATVTADILTQTVTTNTKVTYTLGGGDGDGDTPAQLELDTGDYKPGG